MRLAEAEVAEQAQRHAGAEPAGHEKDAAQPAVQAEAGLRSRQALEQASRELCLRVLESLAAQCLEEADGGRGSAVPV